ncbi:MAG: lytic transglycosylase domain-containing protein [Elusimicrobia bacterium]|nr:lytic transglycosylase domain-containing protein [Elusimicrobiota bacterium]
MLRRLVFLFCLVGAAFWAVSRWGNLPIGVQVAESLLKPVFHKEIINHYSGVYKEDPLFVIALIKAESKFFKKAKSARGAVGLMQIMPQTAKEIAKDLKMKDFAIEDLEDPETNIRFGVHHISKLRKEFGNHDITVLAAYNAGSKNVKDWLRKRKKKKIEYEEIEFYETKKFSQNVIQTYRWLKKMQTWRNQILKRQ